jgi:hypothetical protein
MSKPSEKAMHRAHEWLEAYEGDYVPEGDQVIKECLALQFDAHTAAEREAQHRETWALAQKAHQAAITNKFGAGSGRANQIISSVSCPPIEATKDK